MDYKVERGEIDHLSTDDLSELIATMMTLKVHGAARSADRIIAILETCLVEAVETPWRVIHDDDLITLHRGDDDKPVLLFTKRSP